MARMLSGSNNTANNAHGAALEASGPLLAPLHALNAVASLLRGHALAGNEDLTLPHAAVDIDVLDLNVEWAVRGAGEPAVDLPRKEEEDQKWASKVGLEEGGGCRRISGHGEQRGVERCNKGKDVNENAEV